MALIKKVNGVEVELTAEDEAKILAEWAANAEGPTNAELEADVQRIADDLTENSERDMALALATVDLAIAVRDGQLDGRSQSQVRGLFRDRVVLYLRQRRGL